MPGGQYKFAIVGMQKRVESSTLGGIGGTERLPEENEVWLCVFSYERKGVCSKHRDIFRGICLVSMRNNVKMPTTCSNF